jgi:hypothetical protein
MMNSGRVLLRVATILVLTAPSSVAEEGISLNDQQYFDGPGSLSCSFITTIKWDSGRTFARNRLIETDDEVST